MKIARRQLRVEVPSVAMGDIAFNLLVFFVILARAQDDGHLKWEAASARRVESVGEARISVLIDVNNKLYLNGQEIGIAQLAGRLEELLGDAPAGQRTVLLKVHKESLAQRFEPVLEAIAEAGGDLVHVLRDEQQQAAH